MVRVYAAMPPALARETINQKPRKYLALKVRGARPRQR